MKALSIRQPWAWMIVYGWKDIENRNWHTSYRGRLLIHASKGMTRAEYWDALDVAQHANLELPVPDVPFLPSFEQMPRGGIIGAVDIIDCVEQSESPYFFGPFGLICCNPTPFEFVPWKGRLGLFEVARVETEFTKQEHLTYGKPT